MRLAMFENSLSEAKAGRIGLCRGCGQPVIAKCGTVRVPHWAHIANRNCDSWWEAETEWHRAWKNNFPIEWQEFYMLDVKTNEKHIADVRTENSLTIEFQHSHLTPEEISARESFYKEMVWVVDGARLKRDYPRFIKGQNQTVATSRPGIFHVYDPEKCFPSSWLRSKVPVIFDFKSNELLENVPDLREPLHCLFPIHVGRRVTLARLTRTAFIKAVINGDWSVRINNIMNELLKHKKEWETQQETDERSWQMHESQMRGLKSFQGFRERHGF